MLIAFYLLSVCVNTLALVYVGKHETYPTYGSQKTTRKSQFPILPG